MHWILPSLCVLSGRRQILLQRIILKIIPAELGAIIEVPTQGQNSGSSAVSVDRAECADMYGCCIRDNLLSHPRLRGHAFAGIEHVAMSPQLLGWWRFMYVDSPAAGDQSLKNSSDSGDASIGNLVNSQSQLLL